MVEQNALEALSVARLCAGAGPAGTRGKAASLAADQVRDLFLGGKAEPMLRPLEQGKGTS
jgi:hypothetical protein